MNPIRRSWSETISAPCENVWGYLADTARINEAAGFPKNNYETIITADGANETIGSATFGPFTLRWREVPIQWVVGDRFVHEIEFVNGPIARLAIELRLTAQGEETRCDYSIEIDPKGIFGRLVAVHMAAKTEAAYRKLADQLRAFYSGERNRPFDYPHHDLKEGAKARLDAARSTLAQKAQNADLIDRFVDYVREGPDVDLGHIRPLVLAREWQAERRAVVELCLHGVRVGMLGMQWDLLCPLCRGAKVSSINLPELPATGHCETCNISYGRDFMRNVELTFHPSPAIRAIDSGEYCAAGPMTTPHILLQQRLAAGESRTFDLTIQSQSIRVRVRERGLEKELEIADGMIPELELLDDDVRVGESQQTGSVVIVNHREHPSTVVIEDRAWLKDALTAHRAITLQTFRDLFSKEVLMPGDQAEIETITLMFTDLRGSTALYARIGDAAAYRLVRGHYAYLADKVRSHNGAIVKTIGDAIMAAFADPVDAVRAAIEIQENAGSFRDEEGDLETGDFSIKLGLHMGPAIAVTLNDRLDYFGTTVNMAARLQGLSEGGDIVLSKQLASDPGVARVLDRMPAMSMQHAVKGFDSPVGYLRIETAEYRKPESPAETVGSA